MPSPTCRAHRIVYGGPEKPRHCACHRRYGGEHHLRRSAKSRGARSRPPLPPENNDPDVQYFDDTEGDVLYPDPELSFTTRLADLPLVIQEMIFGNQIDDNGVLIRSANDKPGYFAVGFMSEKANGKYRYVWLYKVRAKPVTESYATKEGTTITRQTGEVEWTAIKRTSDGRYQAIADEGEGGFDSSKAATFLESVYTPTFTPEEDGP